MVGKMSKINKLLIIVCQCLQALTKLNHIYMYQVLTHFEFFVNILPSRFYAEVNNSKIEFAAMQKCVTLVDDKILEKKLDNEYLVALSTSPPKSYPCV